MCGLVALRSSRRKCSNPEDCQRGSTLTWSSGGPGDHVAHRPPRITMGFYARLAPGYLSHAIELLVINPGRREEVPQPVVAVAFAALLLQPLESDDFTTRRRGKTATDRRITWERDIGFEPTTFSLGS